MNKTLLLLLITFLSLHSFGQNEQNMSFNLSIAPNMQDAFGGSGKLLVHITLKNNRQPAFLSANQDSTWVFGMNIKDWQKDKVLKLDANSKWTSTANWDLNNIPFEQYYLQVTWDESKIEDRVEHPYRMSTKVFERSSNSSSIVGC